MLKCGQPDNKNYTFGLRKEQMEDTEKNEENKICCISCGTCITSKMKYCPACGEEL